MSEETAPKTDQNAQIDDNRLSAATEQVTAPDSDTESPGSGKKNGHLTAENVARNDRSERREPRQNKRSSLELRRLPLDVLLQPENLARSSIGDTCDEEESELRKDGSEKVSSPKSFFRLTCLNPKFRLRTQLMLAFGTVSAIAIFFVIVICILLAINSGENVKSINRASFEALANDIEGSAARYLAETVTHRLFLVETVKILYETVRDRFAGYPNDGDDFVPFFDLESRTNKYPVLGDPLPLDWQLPNHVTEDNYHEHVQARWPWYAEEPLLSTKSAVFIMQGACDPSVTDPAALTYFPNCTAANNNVTSGGVVNPSPTNAQIYRKGSALNPVIKALFEANEEVRDMGIFFANSGSGATIFFPHYLQRSNSNYTSIGCDWMKAPNPYDNSRPIATQEQIDLCRPNGTVVPTRMYNPMEREWCRDQVLNPFKPVVFGPFENAWGEGLLMSVGQAVYDRYTNDLIACVYIGWNLQFLDDLISDYRVTNNSEVSLVKWDELGTVVSSTKAHNSTSPNPQLISVTALNIGITSESLKAYIELVDFRSVWDPAKARAKYKNFATRNNGYLVAAYPIPPIPDEYDPTYRPLYLAMTSTSENDIFKVLGDVNAGLDENVDRVTLLSVIFGFVGLMLVILMVCMMSNALTAPLNYMNKAADEIVNNFGDAHKSGKKIESISSSRHYCCTPKTELNDVVDEFNKMVASFSGSFASTAKSVKGKFTEVQNRFGMQRKFTDLYLSRWNDSFEYNVDSMEAKPLIEDDDVHQFLNSGSNIIYSSPTVTTRISAAECYSKLKRPFSSPLFFWTVLLISTPLLLTTITISAVVMYTVTAEFDSSLAMAENTYVDVELRALEVFTRLRADLVSRMSAQPARDLHLLTRYSSWLLFGGLKRTDSITEFISGVEECKQYTNITKCPYYADNYLCDCAWNDYTGFTCTNFSHDTRSLQRSLFIVESNDAFPDGDRNFTSYPNVSFSPQTTAWWSDMTTLPGSEKGASASGYDTLYDRIRVISSLPVHAALYNYDVDKEHVISNYIAFEADGLLTGFFGCGNVDALYFPQWKATEENGAPSLRPELCPLGKYGYDPRCRGWYDSGRRRFVAEGRRLHVTPPYEFASDTATIAQSMTSPMVDPKTNAHVGQAAIDFWSHGMFSALTGDQTTVSAEGFPVLITERADGSGADTVIGPGFSIFDSISKPIAEIVLPYDYDCETETCQKNIAAFDEVVASMKNGDSGRARFERTTSAQTPEALFITYSPVAVRSRTPVDSSDFTRGVDSSEYLIYSLALVETEAGLLQPFQKIEEDTVRQIRNATIILVLIVALAVMLVMLASRMVSISLTEPMLFLLELVRSINRLTVNEEPPKVDRTVGSNEIVRVSDAMETLYKVVRCGNCAFFAGDLEQAYAVMHDALRLFQRLDNKKAISVASNNLGNLMLVMFRAMKEAGEDSCCGMTKSEIISKGNVYFHDAIQLGEKAYDEFYELEGWSPNCLDFMQHLSNRYFNRAMFLLTVKDSHEKPDELEALGLRDLQIARDMDVEIVDQGEEAGWGHVNRLEKLLDVALVRARGHILLQEAGYPDDWEIGEVLDNAYVLLKKELSEPSSDLFRDISPVGRMQVLETELIGYKLIKGKIKTAAQIAIRMLWEDEYTFPAAQARALEAMSAYSEMTQKDDVASRKMSVRLAAYQHALSDLCEDMDKSRASAPGDDSEDLSTIRAMMRTVDSNEFCSRSIEDSKMKRSSLAESRRGFFTMEDF